MFGDSDEEEAVQDKSKGKGKAKGKIRMFDPVSSKLKGKDLREAMLDWSSSSEEEEGEEEEGEGEEELPDLEDLKLPVSQYVNVGDETRRYARRMYALRICMCICT